MKALFVGGSGTISLSIVRRLMDLGWEVWTLNRGNRKDEVPEGVKEIFMDVNDEGHLTACISILWLLSSSLMKGMPDVTLDSLEIKRTNISSFLLHQHTRSLSIPHSLQRRLLLKTPIGSIRGTRRLQKKCFSMNTEIQVSPLL